MLNALGIMPRKDNRLFRKVEEKTVNLVEKTITSRLFFLQIGSLKILKEISRNCLIRKAIADLGG